MELVRPTFARLPEYTAALKRGWSPNNLRPNAAQEQLDEIFLDPDAFIASLDRREANDGFVVLPDGSHAARLPGFSRWIWQDSFCGCISFRWQPGTEDLPPHCSGHVGYAVVPWRRGEGLASAALIALLSEVAATGLCYIELTTSPDNIASIRVIERAGGVFVENFRMDDSLGGEEALRFHISLAPHLGRQAPG